uniref:Uncharacterized protein LOC113784849 n=1 Tax=Cicer arietinum TaxID=3827 RepID=A0A3Q7XSQ6_CICAR|nr:uncharacterized protein LOC113784849 [Cicer arietinum]
MLHSLIINDCLRFQSLPTLPSNLQCLFTSNCPQMKPLNLDPQMLWKTFESHMNQKEEDRPHLWVTNPGREIPPWFNNQKVDFIKPFHHPYNKLLSCDSMASIKVEVPDHCQSSKWWGIAICLALEPLTMQHNSSSPSHVFDS